MMREIGQQKNTPLTVAPDAKEHTADEDLYQVPPPELASQQRRPRRRSLWMGRRSVMNLVGGFGERGDGRERKVR